MSSLFISHSSKDNGIAQEIKKELEGQNHHSIFLDFDPESGIKAGSSWEQTLYRKLRSCHAVIAVCTKKYLESKWCFAEIALARMEGKHIIAMIFDANVEFSDLPSIITDRQVINMTERSEEGWQRLWNGLSAVNILGVNNEWNSSQCPYLGLSSYKEKDAPVFFGRDDEIRSGVELLSRGAPNMVLILGASGSGKSSLVMAGIIPRLRNLKDEWIIVDPFRPGRDPIAELSISLEKTFLKTMSKEKASTFTSVNIYQKLEASAKSLSERKVVRSLEPTETTALNELVWQLSQFSDDQRNAKVLIVVDQFEELLSHSEINEKHNSFLNLLRASLKADEQFLMVLGSMRSDFLGSFQRDSILRGIDYESLSLGPMGIENMRKVIEIPAQLGAVTLEEGLTDRLLKDTETSDALPLLSFTLRKLWNDYGEDGKLELSEYDRLGGLKGAISEEAYAILKLAQKNGEVNALRKAFLKMARLTEEGTYARQAVSMDTKELKAVADIIKRFVEKRLLISYADKDQTMIEVAHESLFRSWSPLKKWLDDNRSEFLFLQQLKRDAESWNEHEQNVEELWAGGKLERAYELITDVTLNPVEKQFIDESQQIANKEKLKKKRRFIFLSLIISSLAIASVFFFWRSFQNLKEANLAILLGEAFIMSEKDPTTALHLASYVDSESRLENKAPKLISGILDCYNQTHFYSKIFPEHGRNAISLTFSPDGKTFLSSGGDLDVFLWNLDGSLLQTFGKHKTQVGTAIFSPDGKSVLTIDYVGNVSLFDLNGEIIDTIKLSTTEGRSVTGNFITTFSPDSTYMLAHDGEQAFLWRPNVDKVITMLTYDDIYISNDVPFQKVVFSPDGNTILSIGNNDIAMLWDLQGKKKWDSQEGVADAAFAPDGQSIYAVGKHGYANIYSLEGVLSENVLHLDGHNSGIRSIIFSPDGQNILTSDTSNIICIHNLSGEVIQTIQGYEEVEYGSIWRKGQRLSFSPNGQYIFNLAQDDQVYIWDVKGNMISTFNAIYPTSSPVVTFSPDSKYILSSHHKTFTLRNLEQKVNERNLNEAQIDSIVNNYLNINSKLTKEVNEYFSPEKVYDYLLNWKNCD